MIVCAGEIEQFAFATPVGIGLTDVAINLTKLCMQSLPENLFFVGTAGSYGEIEPMNIMESSESSNIEQAFLRGDAYTPIDISISFSKDVSHETIVNSSNYICTNEDMAKMYLERNIHLENMEFYAVLKVAEKFGIPAKGIFIVTNYCNAQAHSDFKKNHERAMQKLTTYIQELGIYE